MKPLVLEPGVRIAEKLELVRPLREGGMGAVWIARNLATSAEVAVKVLLPERGANEHAVERFRHEAKLGAMLAHRNITQVIDLVEADETLVLVMELLRGETAREFQERHGRLSTDQAIAIAVPILSALQHAHDRGVVHRDLKPSNIFLHVEPDGFTIPKLLDFGIAKAKDSSFKTRTGDAIGTPSYMSPEQVRAKGDLDGRSDLFSMGVVLYELIAGESPFRAPTPAAALALVLEADVDPDPRLDPKVWIEIKRALSKQAYERHATARELATALCSAVGKSETAFAQGIAHDELAPSVDAPNTAMTVPTVTRPGSRIRNRRSVLYAAAAFSLMALGLVLAFRNTATTPTAEATPPPRVEPPPPALPATAPPPALAVTASIEPTSLKPPPKRPPPAGAKPPPPSIARKPGF